MEQETPPLDAGPGRVLLLGFGKEQQAGPSGHESTDHFANFVAAVRERKRSMLNAEIEEGAISCTLIHLANISYRLGRTLHFDAASMRCRGDEEANRLLRRPYRQPWVHPEPGRV